MSQSKNARSDEYMRGYRAGYGAKAYARHPRLPQASPDQRKPAQREPSHADLTCELAHGDVELALTLWRVQTIWLARRCVAALGEDNAAAKTPLKAARAGELPLFNRLDAPA